MGKGINSFARFVFPAPSRGPARERPRPSTWLLRPVFPTNEPGIVSC